MTGIDHNVAANAQKLGYILLNEDGIERQIAVYEVTLADGIILERNRVGLRNLLRKFWKNIDAAFIVYHHPESVNWRFTYVSELTGYDAEGEFIQIKTEPKRYTYILGEGESIRTAVERFERIINKGNKVSLEDVKEAFSVEKLSKTFFEKYKEHYNNFCEYIISQPGISQTIFNGDEKAIRDFSKKLLGRIVFLYFIQKKGWLGVPENEDWGKGDHHFLTNQFQSFPHKELFYLEFLSVLFFDTLNTKRPNDLIELVKNQPYRIPYLNGGLFEEDNSNHRNLIFPDHLFANLFNSFDQYNFTIYEDDPLDHTIAVDPEMLGHIFENLLEDNKDKGAYYTPKEIVHYMCQESLIEYLNTYCLNCDFSDLGITLIEETQKELITQFIKKKEINIGILEKSSKSKESSKSWFRHLNIALDNVKICDPAIGSGAFPMGLLHEIFTAKQTLHTFEFGNTTNFNASGVKLNIIQNSIYGVDIERGAVDIARLRFWLSLIVDEPKPKALPNLDYKIVVGNSLVSKFGDDIIDIDWEMKDAKQGSLLVDVYQPDEILRKISEKQKQFFSPDSDKKTLAADIRDLKIDLLISQLELMIKTKGMETKPTGTGKTLTKNTEIYLQTVGWKQNIKELKALKNKSDESLNFFDWKLDFPEVMNQQVVENVGFDIVIGNPPYGAKLSALDIKFFKEKYQIKTSETAILFIERGISLNKENGIKTYIIPKSFTFASNYSDIRDFVQKEIALIADCGKAFENVKLEACIISIHKGKIIDNYKSILFKADKSFDFMGNIHKKLKIKFGLFPNGINNSELIIGDKIFEKSDFLNNIANNSRGEIGLQKHLVTEGKYAVIGGKEINKYRIRNIKGYINDVNSISEKAKINKNSVLVQNIVAHITKPYEHIQIISCIPEKTDLILVDTINQITIKENAISSKYIWCLLNSKLVNWYTYLFIFGKAIRTMHFDSPVTSRIPIMLSCENIQNIFIKKSEEIISLKSSGKDTTALEQQIDNIVYKLYELTYEEVKIIDPEFALTEQEYADIKLEGV
ncbi:N-6 DNA methylase [Dolichospermum sp. ST_sed8]|nr:N-6 DNA methylase [Dolichospermum sp. ST_sed8]